MRRTPRNWTIICCVSRIFTWLELFLLRILLKSCSKWQISTLVYKKSVYDIWTILVRADAVEPTLSFEHHFREVTELLFFCIHEYSWNRGSIFFLMANLKSAGSISFQKWIYFLYTYCVSKSGDILTPTSITLLGIIDKIAFLTLFGRCLPFVIQKEFIIIERIIERTYWRNFSKKSGTLNN